MTAPAVTTCRFWSPQKSLSPFPLFPHLFAIKWWDQMPGSSFSECWGLSQLFHSPLSLSSRGFSVPLHFLRKNGVICISEVIDISPGNLDSSLCFFQSSISHDVLCSTFIYLASLVAQMVKHLPAMWVNLGSIPGLGRALEEGMATHSCILAWRIPWTEEPGDYSP